MKIDRTPAAGGPNAALDGVVGTPNGDPTGFVEFALDQRRYNTNVCVDEAFLPVMEHTGADVAMESASVTLVKGDLRGNVRAKRLSRAISAGIRQNLFLAFMYNALSLPLAAFGLVTPMVASAAMSLSSVSVIANSLRLRAIKL